MRDPDDSDRSGIAILAAIANAIAGFLPAIALYHGAMQWISPMGHAEEAMGRGLEAILIGGPIGALVLAAVTGWLVYRSNGPIAIRVALAAIAGLALVSVAILGWENLL